MPDLDAEFAGLRRELRAAVRRPGFHQITAQGRRHTVRRRLQLLALVSAVLAAGVLPILHATRHVEPASPRSSPGRQVLEAAFHDAANGFALGGDCAGHWHSCRPWLMAMQDNGSWQERGVPPIDLSAPTDGLLALGRDRVVVDDHRPDNSIDRYFSRDAGQTWTAVSTAVDSTVPEIPDGAVLQTERITRDGGRTNLCRDGGVTVLLPSDGRSARLAVQPGIVPVWCQRYPDADGTWWVAGTIPGSGMSAVASSRDNGRSWQTSELAEFPLPHGAQQYPAITVVPGKNTTYAVVTNSAEAHELVAVFANTGSGWTRTWRQGTIVPIFAVAGSPVAGADDKLRIPTRPQAFDGHITNVWVSADGGRTFSGENWGTGPMSGEPEWTRGGYVSVADGIGVIRSLEGVSWQELHLPTR